MDKDALVMTRSWTRFSLDDWPAPEKHIHSAHPYLAAVETAKGESPSPCRFAAVAVSASLLA